MAKEKASTLHVRMLTTAAGPEFALQAGDVAEVDTDLGNRLIKDGAAEKVEPVDVQVVSRFHGGLAFVPSGMTSVTTPPQADQSIATEQVQMQSIPLDRRTADEVAVDARVASQGPVAATGPVSVKPTPVLVAEEVAAKVQAATAGDPLATEPKAPASARAPKADEKGK